MSAGKQEWLKDHTDEEIIDIAHDMESRAEMFSPEARQLMNDELRRRKLPLLGFGKSRY